MTKVEWLCGNHRNAINGAEFLSTNRKSYILVIIVQEALRIKFASALARLWRGHQLQ